MANKSRQSANLVSDTNLYVDVTNNRVGVGTLTPTEKLHVTGNLYVSGNISFGGTTTQLSAEQLQIVDADIVLGIGTSFSPTDNTANHGGIAIASTEGSPLVSLKIAPGETNPDTYKKIMWFKNNAAGLGTDAWLANYAVGIGSTQFPTGTRLAAGNVQFTQNDLAVVRNINSSGFTTATNLRVTSGFYDSNNNVGTAGSVLSSTGSNIIWIPPGVQSVGSATSVIVTNTTAETTILTYALPANPTTGTLYRFELRGTYLNNSGSNRTIRFLVKLGGTTISDTGVSGNLGTNAALRDVNIKGMLGISGTNTQKSYFFGEIGPLTAWGAAQTRFSVYDIGAVNLSTSQNLTVTLIHSFAATTVTFTLEMYTVDTISG